MTRAAIIGQRRFSLACLAWLACLVSCTATQYREEADRVSYDAIEQAQQEALGRSEPFTIEQPADTLRRRLLLDQGLIHAGPISLGTRDLEPSEHWPDEAYLEEAETDGSAEGPAEVASGLRLSLMAALQVAARNNRDYQSEKEAVYQTALALDLERQFFRYTWSGATRSLFMSELGREVVDQDGNIDTQTVRGIQDSASLELVRRFKNGITMTGLIGLDLVKMLTQDRASSRGAFFDGTLSIPLLRGSGELVVTEPLTQAERDVIYAIYEFERFKRVFAVSIASEYLGVLEDLDRVRNAEENYRGLITSTRRVRRLADAGWIPEIQVDQARQDELRASNRWIIARESYARRLDEFKLLLGLPTDAAVELKPEELTRLSDRATG